MSVIDIEELHQDTAAILRRLREEREPIAISEHGAIVARLMPVAPARSSPEPHGRSEPIDDTGAVAPLLPASTETGAVLDRLWALGDDLSTRWPKGVTAVDAIRDVRRD